MATISPVRAAARPLPLVVGVALLFGGALWLDGEPVAAVAAAGACAVVMSVAIGQAPARLAWRLEEFASQVPGEPEATVAWHGEGTLEWPDLELTVEGNVHRYRLQDFAVHAGPTTRYLSSSRPREAARTALEELGVEPRFDDDTDRLPSLYPRLAGVKTGLLAVVLAAVAIGLGGPIVAGGVYSLWWWAGVPAVGALFGAGRWLGLAHTRRAIRSLGEELKYGGVALETIDRTDGSIRLEFVVNTTEGSVSVECLAVPHGHITATRPDDTDESVSARLPGASPVADDVAAWLQAP